MNREAVLRVLSDIDVRIEATKMWLRLGSWEHESERVEGELDLARLERWATELRSAVAAAPEPVARVKEGVGMNIVAWYSEDAVKNTPVGTLLYR